MLKYFPVTDDNRTIDIKVTSNVAAPLEEIRKKCDRITAETIEALQAGSRLRAYKNPHAPPSLKYVIVDTKEYLEPLPRNPRKKDKADYIQISTGRKCGPARRTPPVPHRVRPGRPSLRPQGPPHLCEDKFSVSSVSWLMGLAQNKPRIWRLSCRASSGAD